MEIGLLGPLEIVVGDRRGTLPGAGERALLALLALRAGRVVSVDALVDALWGEDLPARPANALQTRVSKLRRALAGLGAPGGAVVTAAPGYRLEVAPGQVDALRVETEIVAARACAAGGDSAEARRRYTAALAAWRGPALADVGDQRWAETEARRLDELRLSALQDRIALDLDAGRHAEVVGELEALLAEHPLRERLHAQLMLALYRSGRQADALAAYQRAREALDRELGLDPSAQLRDLEAAILRQDPALAPPARAPAPPAATPAAAPSPSRRRGNIPAQVASLVGREQELDDVADLLGTSRLVTVTGPGGAGKTTLALAAARRLRAAYQDGAWFADLSGATEPAHVAAVVTAALELPPSDPSSDQPRGARLARQLEARHCLLVIDNCEHLVDAAAGLVADLLSGCPDVRVLATSRQALAVAGEVQYALAPLPLDDAVALFAERARAVTRDLVLDDDTAAAVTDLCARLDGMPLAIELAAARTRTLPLPDLAARLSDRFRVLTGGARTAQARHQTLRATVDWSHQLLSEHERVLLRRVAVFRGGWTVDAAEDVCGDALLDRDDVLDLLDRLVDRSLVVADAGRFRMLETIRDYARQRLDESGEADVVLARHAARMLAVAEECESLLRGPKQLDAFARLSGDHDDLRAALSWCAAGGDVALGQRLAGALGWFWFLGDHEEGRRSVRQQLAAGPGDAASRGRALQAAAIVERPGACVVHPSPSCAAAAEESCRLLSEAGDARRAALSKTLLAVEGIAAGDVDAFALLEEAASVLDDAWSRALIDFVRMELLVYRAGEDAGIAVGDRAADAFAALGDVWGVSAVRAHQGFDLRHLGRLGDALAASGEALTIARAAGLYNTVQMVAAEVGLLLLVFDDEEGAERNFAEAAEVARRYGYRGGEGLAAVGFGHLARRRGDPTARAWFERGAALLREAGSLAYVADACSGLGFAAEDQGDADAAERAHREVLAAHEALPSAFLVAAGLEGLAGVALLRGDPLRAAELLGAAAEQRTEGRRPLDQLLRPDVDRITAAARAALGEAAFDAATARGRQADVGALADSAGSGRVGATAD